ncbi:hypothetical protein F4778DRAFT_466737 [Xylariomycetidae sp. FL2044]|nr:hypothetical protein F4778DRAFT_466737 [Xylariomycetidae sp. FL2044]
MALEPARKIPRKVPVRQHIRSPSRTVVGRAVHIEEARWGNQRSTSVSSIGSPGRTKVRSGPTKAERAIVRLMEGVSAAQSTPKSRIKLAMPSSRQSGGPGGTVQRNCSDGRSRSISARSTTTCGAGEYRRRPWKYGPRVSGLFLMLPQRDAVRTRRLGFPVVVGFLSVWSRGNSTKLLNLGQGITAAGVVLGLHLVERCSQRRPQHAQDPSAVRSVVHGQHETHRVCLRACCPFPGTIKLSWARGNLSRSAFNTCCLKSASLAACRTRGIERMTTCSMPSLPSLQTAFDGTMRMHNTSKCANTWRHAISARLQSRRLTLKAWNMVLQAASRAVASTSASCIGTHRYMFSTSSRRMPVVI